MKKALSIILAVLTMLSVCSLTVFAAEAPVVSGVTCSFEGVELTWQESKDAAAYLVYRDGVCIATTKECKYTDRNVAENTTYKYSVNVYDKNEVFTEGAVYDITYIRPYCAHASAAYVIDYPATVYKPGLKHKHCSECGVDMAAEVIPQLVPTTPVINVLSNRTNAIGIRWNVVDGADAYNVYRRAAGEKYYTKIATIKTNTYYDKTVKSGVYYKYTIKALNEAGLSAYVNGKVICRAAAPTKLSVANTAGGIRFSWNAVEGASAYRVYRKAAGDENWTYLKAVKTTYYPDLDVEPGVDYTYTVRAVVNKTLSAFVEASIRRLEVAKLVSAKSDKEGILVDFEPVEGASGYYVYRKIGNGNWTAKSLLGTINNTKSHTYLDLSAEKGVTYTYTVKAYFKDGKAYSTGSYNAKGISCKDVY